MICRIYAHFSVLLSRWFRLSSAMFFDVEFQGAVIIRNISIRQELLEETFLISGIQESSSKLLIDREIYLPSSK